VSKVFEHPFDLTKVRLQVQVLDATARFRGPLDCLDRTFRNEGMRGLYRVRATSPPFFIPFFFVLAGLTARHPALHFDFRVYPRP
jgi:hypothetical protein